MQFVDDLRAIDATPDDVPMRTMRLRHVRRFRGGSLLGLLRGMGDVDQVVALYEPDAKRGANPVVVVQVDPSEDLEHVAQESLVTVRGWPQVGRAVVILLDDRVVRPIYPCTTSVFRTLRLEGDL